MKVYLITDDRDRAMALCYTFADAIGTMREAQRARPNLKLNVNQWEVLGAPTFTGSESSRSQCSRNWEEE